MYIEPLDTVAAREDALRNVLGTMSLEGMKLDPESMRLFRRWVQGKITLERLGELVDDVAYAGCPERRLL